MNGASGVYIYIYIYQCIDENTSDNPTSLTHNHIPPPLALSVSFYLKSQWSMRVECVYDFLLQIHQALGTKLTILTGICSMRDAACACMCPCVYVQHKE